MRMQDSVAATKAPQMPQSTQYESHRLQLPGTPSSRPKNTVSIHRFYRCRTRTTPCNNPNGSIMCRKITCQTFRLFLCSSRHRTKFIDQHYYTIHHHSTTQFSFANVPLRIVIFELRPVPYFANKSITPFHTPKHPKGLPGAVE